MVDRRKRKVGQVWRLRSNIFQNNDYFLPAGYYKILELVDKDGSKDQDASLMWYKNHYGEVVENPTEYKTTRKTITTKHDIWSFCDEEGPDFTKAPFVVLCRNCGTSADVVTAYSRPTDYICPECSPVN
jgi:hypothetical protein